MVLEHKEFTAQVDAIGRGVDSVVRIVFTDGESHVVQAWTIEDDPGLVQYYDVHAVPGYGKIKVVYSKIERVEPY